MKKMKKLVSALLAMVMVLAMGITTSAAKITINRDDSYSTGLGTETYTYYQILKASYAEGDLTGVTEATGELSGAGKATYYVESEAQKTALEGTGIFRAVQSADGSRWNITLTSESTSASEIVAKLSEMNKEAFIVTDTVNSTGDTTVIDGLDEGYYFIKSSLGSGLAVQTLGDVTINEKNKYPNIDKKQKDEDTATYEDTNVTAKVGDVINYQVTVTVPSTVDKNITFVDTMTTGLTYNNDVTADGYILNTDYAVSNETDHGFKITIDPTAATKGPTMTFTYSATVNSTAVTTADAEKTNAVSLTYSNYTQTDKVLFNLKAAGIFKKDGADSAPLKGVKFTLKEAGTPLKVSQHASGYYYPDASGSSQVVTDANGLIVIRGLDGNKTYKLTETQTLDGYNLLADDVTLTLKDDDSTFEGSTTNLDVVENNKGTQLPSTGGIGTTIFYVVGTILLLGAAVLLVVRRRMRTEN